MFASLFCSECIKALPNWDFYFWLFVGLVVTSFSLLGSHRNFKCSRLVADMPTSKVRSASQGYTELVGVAVKKQDPLVAPVIAPLTARPCLWWHYTIERYQSSGKSSHWVTIEKQTSEAPFYLRDDTGLCAIEPKGAEITALHKKVWRGSSKYPSGSLKSGAEQIFFSFSLPNISLGGRYRYTENLIIDGDPLYALGYFYTDQSGKRVANLKQITGNILRHWKQDFPTLLEKFDQNSNGELDLKEWQTVQKAAEKEAHKQQRLESGKPDEHSLVKPGGGLPFIIGSEAQEAMVKKFRLKALALALSFLATGAFSTWLVSSRFFI